MGYDTRVAGVFTSLGYHVFPFEAFDDAGRLILPGASKIPARWKDAVGRVQSAPAWGELYRIVSVLDNVDPAWRCFMAGIAYRPGEVRLMIVKGTATVGGDSNTGVRWGLSYHDIISANVRAYAGRVTPLDPKLVDPLSELTDYLKNEGGTTKPNPEDPKKRKLGFIPADDETAGGEPIAATAIPSWAAMGAGALLQLVRALTTISFSGKVLSTVLWFPPQPMAATQLWGPVDTDYASSGRRSLHMVWNPNVGSPPRYPRILYGGKIAWRGWGVIDAPHDPWQMCQAFDPTANCRGPALAGDLVMGASEGDLVAAATDADGPVADDAPITVTTVPGADGPPALLGYLAKDGDGWRMQQAAADPPQVVYSPLLQRAFYADEAGRYSPGARMLV